MVRFNIRRLGAVMTIFLATATLGACATAAQPEQMTLGTSSVIQAIAPSHPGYQATALTEVTGGKATNPLWMSKVSNEEFKAALDASLKAKGYAAEGGSAPKYNISAQLVDLKQPLAGLDLTVTSQVRYRVVATGSDRVVLNELIAASGKATVSDAFMAVTRLRLANENSIRANIEAFLDKLDAALRGG